MTQAVPSGDPPREQSGELILPKEERLRLRSEAHHAAPAVLVGAAGLSEAVVREIDRALAAHGLVKVKAPAGLREEREQMHLDLAQRLQAARIQMIGRLMVLYRPLPQPAAPPSKPAGRKKPALPKKQAGARQPASRKADREATRKADRKAARKPTPAGRPAAAGRATETRRPASRPPRKSPPPRRGQT